MNQRKNHMNYIKYLSQSVTKFYEKLNSNTQILFEIN